jgi:tRNA 5-methylaminomethyl-2-thiouridine biosynthesis bifunctional protein
MSVPSGHERKNFCLDEAPLSMRDGVLRADDFNDLYFSSDGGLSEADYVFLEGSDLARRLIGPAQFTIAETGFGTGLNFLAVMALVDRLRCDTGKMPAQVDYISFESRPLPERVMRQAHSSFGSLSAYSDKLVTALPPRWAGLHRRNFFGGLVRLHLFYGDAIESLKMADFKADAWFLDGFSPAKNPDLWTAELLMHVGRLSRAGGSVASFTAARMVRENLANAGFEIQKRPGFGLKRDMIVGRKAGRSVTQKALTHDLKIGIIGGGIAGASVAAGLAARGITPYIIDAGDHLASAASGNRLGLQSPRITVDHNPLSRLSADCLSFAAWYSDCAGSSLQRGVISLDWPMREAKRQDKFRAQFWPADLMFSVDRSAASSTAGVELPLGGMWHQWARVIEPSKLTHALAASASLQMSFIVEDIRRKDEGFSICAADGRELTFNKLVLAAGADIGSLLRFADIEGLAIDITSGQVSQVPAVRALNDLAAGLSFGGYLTPAYNGFHELGASFDRAVTDVVTDLANQQNRNRLPPALAALMPESKRFKARVSRRASSPDRAPVVGPVDNSGLYVIGALGARGLTFGPLLGDMLAAHILNMPMTLDRQLWQLLGPFRFRLRASRL